MDFTGFLVNKGLISHVTIKICKENFNIHTVDIRVHKMSPYLLCSNMGKWNCNESSLKWLKMW